MRLCAYEVSQTQEAQAEVLLQRFCTCLYRWHPICHDRRYYTRHLKQDRMQRYQQSRRGSARSSVAFVPLKVAEGLANPEDADLIALAALVLGVFMGHRNAAAMILLMITGGEALEDYALRELDRRWKLQ